MNFRQPNEDLFDSTRMSFGEHLEELRKVLTKCLIWVAIGCGFGFWFANPVVRILEGPLVDAMADYNEAVASEELIKRDGYVAPELQPWLQTERFMPRHMRVDPAELVRALQTVVPDFAAKVQVEPYAFQPSNFRVEALPDLCGLLSQSVSVEPSPTSRVAKVWTLLTSAEQETVTRLASQSAADESDVTALTEILNRLAKETALFDAAEFASELTEPETSFISLISPPAEKPLAKMKAQLEFTQDSNIARRLNRALLTQLFSEQMFPLKMELVPIDMWESSEFKPQSLSASEPFLVWMKAGVLTGLVLAGPFIFYHLWSFVAAGLYPHEQKYVHLFLPISIGLFVSGVLLAFLFVFGPVLEFLFSFNRQMDIAPQLRINDWLSFVMFLPLGFGIAFQLPLVMLFMNRIGLFQVSDYLNKWRVSIMIIFVISMLLTPSDPISMMLMAVPLTILYFLGIAMCQWMPKNKNPFAEPEREYSTS